MNYAVRLIFFGWLGISLFSCQGKKDLDDHQVPTRLVVGIMPGEDPEQTYQRMQPIRKYLEKKLAMEVQFVKSTDYTAVIEALRSKKVHVAYLSPFSYILATKRGNVVPLVALGTDGKARMYQSVIITSKNSGLKTMADVKAKAKTLSLCFSDPASTSGHLIPRAYLTTIGLDPTDSFKETLFASSNTASIMTVKAGKVDIGCTYQTELERLMRKGILKQDDIVILWTSDPIVSGPIVIRKDISKDFAKRVQEAYLDLPRDEPDIFKEYISFYYKSDENFSYIQAYDSLYNGIRKIAAGIKDFKMAK